MPKTPTTPCQYRELAAQIRALATSCLDQNTVTLALKVARECVQLGGAKKKVSPARKKAAAAGRSVLLKVRQTKAKPKPRSKTRALRMKSAHATK